jgi:hypothetical protein
MIISDLSYLESTTSNVEGGDNYATVIQTANASAGNNSGYGNYSYGNSATALNIANVYQVDNDSYYYSYPYYHYYHH